jgi:VWFA-related protein
MRPAVLALQLIVATVYAQSPLTERIEVSVVNVDVSVTGAGGQPIRGLIRDDFEVFEDGRRQPITNFYAVSGGLPSSAAAAEGGGAPLPEARFRRRVLVLVDVFHTTRRNRSIALASLEKMIDDSFQTGDYDWSFAILGRGVTVALPLTTDKHAIHDALQRMVNAGERTVPALAADQPLGTVSTGAATSIVPENIIDRVMSYEEENRILAGRYTTAAIVDAVRGFASTPGKKIVLFLTGDPGLNDLALTTDNFSGNGGSIFQRPLTPELGRRARDITDMRTAVVREANTSGVSMYIFNVEGLQPMGDIGVAPKAVTNTAAAFWLSKDTGGRLVTGNDPALALRQFDAMSSTYYSLGYRAPHPGDGKYHQIEVRLKNVNGARLDYRTGYSSASAGAELARAMESPLAATLIPSVLPVTLETGKSEPDRQGVAIPISVKVPFSALQFLPVEKRLAASVRVFVSVFDALGRRVFSGSFPVAIGIPAADPSGVLIYKNKVVIGKKTRNQIITAVRDETTDTVGTATAVITTE